MNIKLSEVPVRGLFETLLTHALGRVVVHGTDIGGSQTLVELTYPNGNQIRRLVHSGCIVAEVA